MHVQLVENETAAQNTTANAGRLNAWQAERGSRQTHRHPRDDPRAEIGEDVRVGVGPMEFKLNGVRALLRWCLATNSGRSTSDELKPAVVFASTNTS